MLQLRRVLHALGAEPQDMVLVYDDIDKEGYPDAWRAARERIRIGGLYICDNVLWSGRVAEPDPDERTHAIMEHNAMIAAELHISPKTVKNHISNILMKLQIDNRIQAAVYAVRSGIV